MIETTTTNIAPEETAGYKAEAAPAAEAEDGKLPDMDGEDGDDDMDDDGEAPDMAGLEAMMGGGMGGEGGAGGMDMNALMAMMGKGGGKGGGMGGMADMMGGMGGMGDMGGMMGGGGKGGGKGQQAPEEEVEKTDEKGFTWSQKGEEVNVRFALDPPCTNKKEIEVKFKATSLKVVIRGETKIDGALGGKVEVDDCTWCFSPTKDELIMMLTKVEGKTEQWRNLLA